MSVDRNLPLVLARRQEILAGDKEKIAHQKDAGKLTARERVRLLMDEASFVELDVLAGGGVVTGYGLVNGRSAYVYAQDYTVKAGAIGKVQANKILTVMSLAEKTGSPLIALLDSQGALLDEGMTARDALRLVHPKEDAWFVLLRRGRPYAAIDADGLMLKIQNGGALQSPLRDFPAMRLIMPM